MVLGRCRHARWCANDTAMVLTVQKHRDSSVAVQDSFVTFVGLRVHCLLALFPYGIVLLGLLAGPPLGGCQFLVMLLVWLLLVLGLFGRLLLMVLVWRSSWVRGSGPGRTRIRLNRKTPAHLVGSMVQSRPRVWKRLRHLGLSSVSLPDPKRRRGDQDDGGYHPAQIRIGVG